MAQTASGVIGARVGVTGRPVVRPRALIAGLVGVALAATFGLLAGPATPLIVGLTVVLASALLFWQWPYAALLAMLVVRGGVPNIELPNLLIATGGALGLAFSGAPLPPKRITLPFVAFLALALFSVPLTPSGDIAPENKWLVIPIVDVAYFPRGLLEAREWLRVASILVICWLAFSVTRTTRDVQRVVAAVLLSGAVCVGWGLWQWVNGMTVVRQGFEGVAGPFTHASYYAHYLLVIIAIGLAALFTTGPRFLKLLVWVVLPGAVLCLFLSYSRAAWIGAVVIVAVMAVLEYRRIFVVLAIAVPLAIGFLPQVTANAERRFADLSPESGAATANSWNWRKDHWSRMRPLAFEKPLTAFEDTPWNFHGGTSAAVVGDTATPTGKAIAFRTPAVGSTAQGIQRTEQVPNLRVNKGDYVSFAGRLWVPSTFKVNPSWQLGFQAKSLQSEGYAPFVLLVGSMGNDFLAIEPGGNGAGKRNVGPLPRGRYTDLVITAYYTDDQSAAWVEVWRDGIKVLARTSGWYGKNLNGNPMGTLSRGDTTAYFKIGLYRGDNQPEATELRWSDLRVYRTRSPTEVPGMIASAVG